MMDKLKPCPFCGGKAIVEESDYWSDKTKYLPHCVNFGNGCWCMQENWFDTPEEAAAAWNRRDYKVNGKVNGDLISREAALEIVVKYCPDDDGSCSKADVDPREMLDEIDNLPAVDAAPVVHGYWKIGGCDGDLIGNWECSVCDGISLDDSRYCPNCGAKMDGGNDDGTD